MKNKPTALNESNLFSIQNISTNPTEDATGRFAKQEGEPKSAEFRNSVSRAIRKISDFDKSSADEEEMRDKITDLNDKTY